MFPVRADPSTRLAPGTVILFQTLENNERTRTNLHNLPTPEVLRSRRTLEHPAQATQTVMRTDRDSLLMRRRLGLRPLSHLCRTILLRMRDIRHPMDRLIPRLHTPRRSRVRDTQRMAIRTLLPLDPRVLAFRADPAMHQGQGSLVLVVVRTVHHHRSLEALEDTDMVKGTEDRLRTVHSAGRALSMLYQSLQLQVRIIPDN